MLRLGLVRESGADVEAPSKMGTVLVPGRREALSDCRTQAGAGAAEYVVVGVAGVVMGVGAGVVGGAARVVGAVAGAYIHSHLLDVMAVARQDIRLAVQGWNCFFAGLDSSTMVESLAVACLREAYRSHPVPPASLVG